MFRLLPPPPQFILPPPPMLPADILDSKMLLRLTCSSIPHQQQINPQLILISCLIFFMITIFLTLSFIWIQSYRQQKTLINNLNSKSTSIISRDVSICSNSSRSYETISSGTYLESINTSATTLSTTPGDMIYNHYHQISSPPLYYDILPC